MLPTMTVAENVFIDALPQSGGLVDRGRMRKRTAWLLERLGSRLLPERPVEELSTGDRQMVEIARALSRDPRIIIFDEPTSSLTDRERQRLFAIIRQLRQSGVAVIYITHFLDEIFHICDRVTVMRNGQTVGSSAIAAITPNGVVRLMLGEVERRERLREPMPPPASRFGARAESPRRAARRQFRAASGRNRRIVGPAGLRPAPNWCMP